MRLVLRAGFDVYSGYGNDAVDMAIALQEAGCDVTVMPMNLMPGLPPKFTRLLEKDPRGKKDAVLQFSPPFDLKHWEVEDWSAVTVGYTMWERTPMRLEDFMGHLWEPHDVTLADWSHLIVTCPMNVEAMAPWMPEDRISVVPCGIDPDLWPVWERSQKRRMRFLYAGMLNGRKDPFALLEAWRELKAEKPEFDAVLRMHSLAPGLHPRIPEVYPDVEISSRLIAREDMPRLYAEADCYVCTSRGEGNNKPAMEAMATGLPVIATDWSGHQNWLHSDVGWPVPGELREAQEAPGAREFYVDREALKQALWDAWADREATVRKGQVAARWIRQSHSWEHVVKRLMETVARLL